MLMYYSVVLVAPDSSTAESHCLANSPDEATAKIQAEIKAEGMEATIQSVTPLCEANLRSLRDAGVLLTLDVQEFMQVLAGEILLTNQAVEQVAKQVVAKSRRLQVAKSKELAGPIIEHSDEFCYSISRFSARPDPNAVLDGAFEVFFNRGSRQ